jgi:hypothetical protein
VHELVLDDLRDLLHSSPRLKLDKLISLPPRSIGPNVIGTDELGESFQSMSVDRRERQAIYPR